eukprot:9430790-Lingulodinium_polyedra.AAC.1
MPNCWARRIWKTYCDCNHALSADLLSINCRREMGQFRQAFADTLTQRGTPNDNLDRGLGTNAGRI